MAANKQFGWGGEVEAARNWDLIGDAFAPFFIGAQTAPTQGRTFRAWDLIRRNLGHDLIKQRQQTGDCVAMSTKDLLGAIQILEIENGDPEEYHPLFAPYLYAAGRCLIGQNRLRGAAGSFGSWQAKAVEKFGALRSDLEGVPGYSGALADEWGDNGGNWRRWVSAGDDHCIGQTSRIMSWTQLVDAITNGYLCTIASSQGFEMKPRSDGYHRRRGTWNHQMGIWGVSDDRRKPWVAISNQWGDVHGRIKDFETKEPWPPGMLRVRPDDLDRLYRSGEIIAYSAFDGFPDRSASWNDWSLL